jgi:serine/threonine protein kinase
MSHVRRIGTGSGSAEGRRGHCPRVERRSEGRRERCPRVERRSEGRRERCPRVERRSRSAVSRSPRPGAPDPDAPNWVGEQDCRYNAAMRGSTTPRPLKLSVACGPVPCDTEEGRSFLQERLGLFGRVIATLTFIHWATLRVIAALSATGSTPALDSSQATHLPSGGFSMLEIHHALAFLIGVGLWALCKWRRLGHLALGVADIGTLCLLGVVLGFKCSEAITHADSARWVALIALSNIILGRGIVVPSTALQTSVAGVVASLPVIAGSYSVSNELREPFTDASWAALAIAMAAVASRIIYGLREEVREAREFGQYRIDEKIGAGGMGEVYRANHLLLRRPTAIKLLKPELGGERDLARFEREVTLTSRLTHPNTIIIYDYGRTPDGSFYYAMELLEGSDLETFVQKTGPLPPSRVIHVLRQVCASLAEAHSIGLIHRDIKPANLILCTRGGLHDFVKVVDFGLVKDIEGRADVTASGAATIAGTPLYMSPEAIRAPGTVDGRSDIYAVGAVGYYLLTGLHVFESTNFLEICSHHLQTKPVPPSIRSGRDLPIDLEGLILMCLEKRKEDRPKDARSLALALERCRDAGSWTETDAEEWWQKHEALLRSWNGSASESLLRRGDSADAETVPGHAVGATRSAIFAEHQLGQRG